MNYQKRLLFTIGLLALLSGIFITAYFLHSVNVFVLKMNVGYLLLLLALGLADLLWGSWVLILRFWGANRHSEVSGNTRQVNKET